MLYSNSQSVDHLIERRKEGVLEGWSWSLPNDESLRQVEYSFLTCVQTLIEGDHLEGNEIQSDMKNSTTLSLKQTKKRKRGYLSIGTDRRSVESCDLERVDVPRTRKSHVGLTIGEHSTARREEKE